MATHDHPAHHPADDGPVVTGHFEHRHRPGAPANSWRRALDFLDRQVAGPVPAPAESARRAAA